MRRYRHALAVTAATAVTIAAASTPSHRVTSDHSFYGQQVALDGDLSATLYRDEDVTRADILQNGDTGWSTLATPNGGGDMLRIVEVDDGRVAIGGDAGVVDLYEEPASETPIRITPSGAQFVGGIDLDGDTMAVAGYGHTPEVSRERLWVFERGLQGWTEVAMFDFADSAEGNDGRALALDGETIAFGGLNDIHILHRQTGTWQVTEALPNTGRVFDAAIFGRTVAAVRDETVEVWQLTDDATLTRVSSIAIPRRSHPHTPSVALVDGLLIAASPSAGTVGIYRLGELPSGPAARINADVAGTFGTHVAARGNTLLVGAEAHDGGDLLFYDIDQVLADAPPNDGHENPDDPCCGEVPDPEEPDHNARPETADDRYALPLMRIDPLAGTFSTPSPGVLENDTDPDGDTLAVRLVDAPAHGSIELNPDGSFTYTPTVGFTGTDTFTYEASDGFATSAPATVTLSIT